MPDELDITLEDNNEEEYIFDEVTGSKGKKSVLSNLNKKKLSKWEMDNMFCDFY